MHFTTRLVPALLASAFVVAGTSLADGPLAGEIIFSCDPVLDRVLIYHDTDGDGTYEQPGETVVLYDSALGPVALPEPVCLTQSPDDTLYVGDATDDIILAINDSNEDDDAYDLDPTLPTGHEAWIYFDGRPGGNAGGIRMERVTGVSVTTLGVVWVSMRKESVAGLDAILRLEDHNGDGDANDSGEAVVYYSPAPGQVPGFSSLSAVKQGQDGLVYALQNGTGVVHGIYRLSDLDGSGAIDQPGEAVLYFQPLPGPGTSSLVALDQDNNEYWYVLDEANGEVLRARDFSGNGLIDPLGETTTFMVLQAGASHLDLAVTGSGHFYIGNDSATHQTITRAIDFDGSGTVQAGESNAAYDDQVQSVDTDSLSGLAADFHSHGGIGSIFCGGAAGFCPCGNAGSALTGCANSTGAGAQLKGEGSDSITNDDMDLVCEGLPAGKPALFYQGTLQANGGVGNPFGDGMVCVGGQAVRLGTAFADGAGIAVLPPPHVAAGGWTVGATRYFQARYRDSTGPCASGFNYSNGLAVTFTP